MATRQGLNATLSYARSSSVTRVYRVRCNKVVHGIQMVSDESQARMRRAYYPHRVTTQKFAISVLLSGFNERQDFTSWMSDYASFALDPDFGGGDYPTMSVVVPSYEFNQRGVPLTGYEWGDHVGSMVFNPQVIFEAAYEPWQKAKPTVTHVDATWSAFAQDPAIKYFYPFGEQLSGEQTPDRYDKVVYPGDPSQFNNNYYGGGVDPSGQPLPPSSFQGGN